MGLFIVNLRRSTTGLALNAVRWSEPGSKTLGISVLQMKVIVAGLAAFVAGIGGAMLALSLGVGPAGQLRHPGGVVWLAVLVTQGIRSNMAALFAGLSFTFSPGVALVYLPQGLGQRPAGPVRSGRHRPGQEPRWDPGHAGPPDQVGLGQGHPSAAACPDAPSGPPGSAGLKPEPPSRHASAAADRRGWRAASQPDERTVTPIDGSRPREARR